MAVALVSAARALEVERATPRLAAVVRKSDLLVAGLPVSREGTRDDIGVFAVPPWISDVSASTCRMDSTVDGRRDPRAEAVRVELSKRGVRDAAWARAREPDAEDEESGPEDGI